ncbi:MAG: sigma-54-dependent Fis family transcriptional regulator [Candidatus Marinimicrobia bacterium]|nr:sigma-54-dependent Fis family transcriptional regulator [Candidatus Neomarinimicrobiota bacterium]MBL7046662.1 sigma-54-dependent Fis family transcriptional regulator [Candidatus Neomarinimicrobiota bacterium]
MKDSVRNELEQVFKDNQIDITITQDWASALAYVAVDNYSSVWMDWDILKDYYADFHRRLLRLNKHLPLVVFVKKPSIGYQMYASKELLFSVLPLDRIPEEADELVKRLKLYRKMLSEVPGDVLGYLRPNGFGPFIGNSPSMLKLYQQIAKVAPTDITVLISGGSGSGKELVARTIHDLSPRQSNSFVSLNCAAIPENLLESELFGYEKGAFTGAGQSKPGKFELAHKGTIFLDEIGDMPLTLQVKLLRVLEEHTVERLGGTTSKKVDIRVLAATNQDLAALIREKEFRSDLNYRLNVIPIQLSSLSRRREDIVLLTLHILGKLSRDNSHLVKSISWEFLDELKRMEISGNVRELENFLTRALFQSNEPILSARNLREVVTLPNTELAPEEYLDTSGDGIQPLWEVEKITIKEALNKLNWNISQVASQLEISRTALYRKIKKYNLSRFENS